MNRIGAKSGWQAVPGGVYGLVLGFAVVSSLVRAAAMFGPAAWRGLFMLACIAMALLPWLLLDRSGRRAIGLQRPIHPAWLLAGLAIGALAASFCYWLGAMLYGTGPDNWYISVARNYQLQPTAGWSLLQLHLVFTTVAILFSPIGEEIFFRGLLQKVLEERHGATRATLGEAAWFALVHLCHHGILATSLGWTILPVSGALWVAQMFLLSLAFAWLRRRSDSIWSAVLAHAAFNAAMNGWIFARLWPA